MDCVINKWYHFCSLAGLPPGVVNMVFGYGQKAGQALVEHPDVPVISFTGGPATGKKVVTSSAANFKKLSLEVKRFQNNLL